MREVVARVEWASRQRGLPFFAVFALIGGCRDPEGRLESVVGFAPEWSLNASGDTLRFNFIDGFSGATIQFARADAHGDTLRGVVTEHWDFGPPFSNDKGRAYAVRRSCP